MNISTEVSDNIVNNICEHTNEIRSFYDNMQWNDEVYESFDEYARDMENHAQNTCDLVQSAKEVIGQITDVNVGALESEFNAACTD